MLHFTGPRSDLTLFVKLIQQVAVKGVVSRTIFGLVFSARSETLVENEGQLCPALARCGCVPVCVHVCLPSVCILVTL